MAYTAQTLPDLLTIEEYLTTAYRPDCEFIDGHLEERHLGTTKHGILEMQLGFWFLSFQQEWNIQVIAQQRTQVAATRVRLPDVTVAYNDSAILEEVRTTPPLIAIEILSPNDRVDRVKVRLADLLRMGIPHVWLLDPIAKTAHTFTVEGLKRVEEGRIDILDSPIYLDLDRIFATIP